MKSIKWLYRELYDAERDTLNRLVSEVIGIVQVK